jgi:hypothetical protein
VAWRSKGDSDRAIADFSEAIKLDPNEAIKLDPNLGKTIQQLRQP